MDWHDSIPPVEKGNSLDLWRTPPKGKAGGIVTSTSIVGCFTHYFGGRTIPCEGATCKACGEGIGNRWHGYVGVYCMRSRKHGIFEFTAKASLPFQAYIELTGRLRGCEMVSERKGYRGNSPVIITCSPANLEGIDLPEPPNLKKILSNIWGLPSSAVKRGGSHNFAECIEIDPIAMAKVRGPDNRIKNGQKVSS